MDKISEMFWCNLPAPVERWLWWKLWERRERKRAKAEDVERVA